MKINNINWNKVKNNYNGIIFNNYNTTILNIKISDFYWYYNISSNCGCIFNTNIINNFAKLENSF